MQDNTDNIENKMAAISISQVITPPKKRKRHISFFDGDSDEKPRPQVTITYDKLSGDTVSVQTFDQERLQEEHEYQQLLERKRRKRAKLLAIKEAKTPEQDLLDALSELSYNPLDVNNLFNQHIVKEKNTDSD